MEDTSNQLLDEHVDYRWCDKKEAMHLMKHKNDLEALRTLLNLVDSQPT